MPLARSPEVKSRLTSAQAFAAQQNERIAVVLEMRAARRLGQEMTAEQAQLNLLASEFSHVPEPDLRVMRNNLREVVRNHEYVSMRHLVEEVWKVCPDAFPDALTAITKRSHVV